jgi:glycosyltransferase involved in cell wall biosynthesis
MAKRIAYLSTALVPHRAANSMHVMKMCQAFNQEGYATSLVVQWQFWSGLSGAENIWNHYGVRDTFPLIRIPRVRLFKLIHHNLISAYYARWGRFDLVYGRNLGAVALTAAMNIPTIFEYHAPIEERKLEQHQFQKLLKGPGFRQLVVITQALKEHFLESYPGQLTENQVIVAPDGVDLERFADPPTPQQARAELGLSPERFTMGYAGHLYPGRGMELILSLAERTPEAFFLIVGGNEDDIRLHEAKTRELNLSNIKFFGF